VSSIYVKGRNDIAEILLKVALNTKNQIKSNHPRKRSEWLLSKAKSTIVRLYHGENNKWTSYFDAMIMMSALH